jgi:hypothetical protein
MGFLIIKNLLKDNTDYSNLDSRVVMKSFIDYLKYWYETPPLFSDLSARQVLKEYYFDKVKAMLKSVWDK